MESENPHPEPPTQYIATTLRGFEQLSWQALRRTLPSPPKLLRESPRTLTFHSSAPLSALLELRSVEDIFVYAFSLQGIDHTRASLRALAIQMAHGQLTAAFAAVRAVRVVPEAPHFAVTVSAQGARNYSRYEVAEAVAPEIASQIGGTFVTREPGKASANELHRVSLEVRIILLNDGEGLVGLRLAERPLHRRAYQVAHVEGGLNPVAAYLAAAMVTPSRGVILDPTCGSATFLIEAVSTSPALRAIGVDISPSVLQAAQRNCAAAGAAVQLVIGNAASLPIADGAADAVVWNPPWESQVELHAGANYREMMKECARVLKVGGKIACITDRAELVQEALALAPLQLLAQHPFSLYGRHPVLHLIERR